MKKGSSYHHGDLRAALLRRAHLKLEQGGHEALSLRALAADMGVSPSAPYNHFKTRHELLAALVVDGCMDLVERYRVAEESKGSPLHRLELACLEHLAFASRRPGLFRLMFATNANWESELETTIDEAMIAYGVFQDLTAATMPDADPDAITARALAIWATTHGMAVLKSNGRLTRRYAAGQGDLSVIQAILRPGTTS